MSFKPYDKYQKTTVDWLGEVPASWKVKPCRAIVRNMVEKNEGALDQNYLSLMANVGVIKYEDKGDVGNKKPDDLSKCKIIKKGNLVINSMNYSIGSYGMSKYDGVCSPVYIVLDPDENVVHRRFALRIFENSPFQKYLATFGNGILAHRAAIGWDDIKGAYIPIPSKDEQLSILNFLDHETAKIDTLIAKQQQLIKLLKEKRQAVISHAVTRGLNPDAPMKDSGVEWLGKVPEHWVVTKSSYVFSTSPRNGTSPAVSDSKNAIPTFSISAVRNGKVDIENNLKWTSLSTDEAERFRVNSNDILLVRGNGNLSMVGQAGCVNGAVPSKCIYPDILIKVEISRIKMTNEFFVNSWNSSYVREQLERKANTTNGTYKVSGADIRAITMVQPPIDEQKEIVQKIEELTDRFRALMDSAEKLLIHLKERRTSLISAAVTGKIDVRNWQPPHTESAMEVST